MCGSGTCDECVGVVFVNECVGVVCVGVVCVDECVGVACVVSMWEWHV